MATLEADSPTMSREEETSASGKKKLFYTTSDMMTTINKALSDMDSPDDGMNPRVELQRRMPDGTTRRADEKDLEAADLDSKLKQVQYELCIIRGISRRRIVSFSHKKVSSFNILGCGRSSSINSREKDGMGSASAKRG